MLTIAAFKNRVSFNVLFSSEYAGRLEFGGSLQVGSFLSEWMAVNVELADYVF